MEPRRSFHAKGSRGAICSFPPIHSVVGILLRNHFAPAVSGWFVGGGGGGGDWVCVCVCGVFFFFFSLCLSPFFSVKFRSYCNVFFCCCSVRKLFKQVFLPLNHCVQLIERIFGFKGVFKKQKQKNKKRFILFLLLA